VRKPAAAPEPAHGHPARSPVLSCHQPETNRVQLLLAAAAIDAALARALLGPSRESAEIVRLTRARAMAVEAAESERRRVERDLHDGFQAKAGRRRCPGVH